MGAAALFFALRPVSISDAQADDRTRDGLSAVNLSYVDLTEAVDRLRQVGFIELDGDDGESLASRSYDDAGNSGTGVAADLTLPKVSAIVRSGGRWTAYLKLDASLQKVQEGETAGPWQIDKISQGEITFSAGEVVEKIDIFGAKAAENGRE